MKEMLHEHIVLHITSKGMIHNTTLASCNVTSI